MPNSESEPGKHSQNAWFILQISDSFSTSLIGYTSISVFNGKKPVTKTACVMIQRVFSQTPKIETL